MFITYYCYYYYYYGIMVTKMNSYLIFLHTFLCHMMLLSSFIHTHLFCYCEIVSTATIAFATSYLLLLTTQPRTVATATTTIYCVLFLLLLLLFALLVFFVIILCIFLSPLLQVVRKPGVVLHQRLLVFYNNTH